MVTDCAAPISATIEQLLDSSPDGVLIVDTDGRIRLVNRQAEAMFGYDRDELVGELTVRLRPDRDRPDPDESRVSYYRNPTIGTGLDIAALRKDGTEFPLDASFSLLETDGGRFVYISVRDSSARKKIEARSQSFEVTSQLAAIVESSDDAIVGKSLDGVITAWNAAAEHMYGYSVDEIIGHNISELIPPDQVDELSPILERVSQGERVEHFETKRVRKDGTILELSVTLSPIRDDTGTVTGASTVARDLTELRKAEAEHLELEDRLRQSERLESLGQLAGGVAHDFNNLLAGIMNYASLISSCLQDEMTLRGLSDDDAFVSVVQDADEITKVAKRAAALTHQLLIFSRREIVQAEVLDLNAIVSEIETLLRTTVPENVELRLRLAPDLPLIKADRSQIDQVFMNLAVNARDAMPDGGELEIETATFEVDQQYARINAINAGTYVRLTVSDTGTGMTREVVARTFEPFFTTKPKGEGTGLGLATVYGIVRQAGGDVSIYSEPGLGTTVRVNLPVTSDVRSAREREQPSVPREADGETVLLVEDEEIVREPTRRMLERNGYRVLAAANAEEALVLLHGHPGAIHLLLTDVVMPGRSGRDLSADVLEDRPETKVLFMSGYSQNVIAHQGVIEAGVYLIEKPFAADDLLRKVRDALDGAS
jgi:PAS domain S-box-containing protein